VEPELLDFNTPDYDGGTLVRVAVHLKGGGLVAMPTETVYGFGCLPELGPVGMLQSLKGREADKPFLLLIPDSKAVPELQWSPEARELASVFWPGALTLILSDSGGCYPPGVRSEQGGVAVRVSPHPLVQALLGALGGGLVSTSANHPGAPPALGAEGAYEIARKLGGDEKMWVLDGGFLEASDPSTIVDCTGPSPVVTRSGAIPLNRIRCVLPEIDEKL
jgi:L-threonylcarbamoyladenylate synthase